MRINGYDISGFKSRDVQSTLWDFPIGNHGHVRTVLGDFVEDLTALLLGGKRHKTDSTKDYCPDVSVIERDAYFECKAAGLSKQTFVYEGRVERDRDFAAHHGLFYVIWHHRTETKLARTVNELKQMFLANMQRVYIVPFMVIDDYCRSHTPEKLNSKYGKHSDAETYGSGYRINLRDIAEYAVIEWNTEGKT